MQEQLFYRLAELMEDKYGEDYQRWYWLVANFISFECNIKTEPAEVMRWATSTVALHDDLKPAQLKVLLKFFGLEKAEDFFSSTNNIPEQYYFS